MITNGSVISELARRIPEFQPSEEDVSDGLTYLVINDLGRYISARAASGDRQAVGAAISVLEALVSEGDNQVQQLVSDCLWGILESPEFSKIEPFFGPQLKQLRAKLP